MDKDDVISTLNDLIETSKDGEYGFRTCAERASAPDLKNTFTKRAASCAAAAAELQGLVRQQGGEAEEGGSVSGSIHRGWVSVRDAVSGHSDKSVLDECERGEDAALARYRKALKQELPPAVKAVVEKQMAGVQANHDEVKRLRDAQKTNA